VGGWMALGARNHMAAQAAQIFSMPSLWRLATWGMSAAIALGLAVAAGYSDAGSQRLMIATHGSSPAGASQKPNLETEIPKLAETVRAVASEREQLSVRLGRIERQLEDLTGSIKRQAALPGDDAPLQLNPPDRTRSV